ncbi:PREDICTED: spherulin-2A-like [Papilio xuthus]|uniref:Spherulin-2A-like n=1 Tax=Papilio xuthus TaxID=66420 RepID=A0AAJ6ZSY1_PAPXU|nr:PREDICTED: spherulin-2A-like [Papilio xuthus]
MFKLKLLLFLIVLTVVESKISIDVNIGNTPNNITINYSGFEVNVIGKKEIELFKISNANIKQAVKEHYGRKPNNVYLKSPTPWGDLYKKYKWEEVSRVLTVKSAIIKSINKKQIIILSHDFENVSNNTIKVNTGISQTVENTITTSWAKSKETTISQDIEYEVNVMFGKAAGKTGISFTSTWGESEERSESVTISASSSVETELKPGQAATAVLSASKGSLEVEVLYLATLRGNVVVNYKSAYKGHHFFGPSVDGVMKSGGIDNEVIIKEIINIGFYTEANLKVYDKVSGETL